MSPFDSKLPKWHIQKLSHNSDLGLTSQLPTAAFASFFLSIHWCSLRSTLLFSYILALIYTVMDQAHNEVWILSSCKGVAALRSSTHASWAHLWLRSSLSTAILRYSHAYVRVLIILREIYPLDRATSRIVHFETMLLNVVDERLRSAFIYYLLLKTKLEYSRHSNLHNILNKLEELLKNRQT